VREPSVTVEHANGLPAALAWVKDLATRGLAAGPVVIVLRRPKRSDLANRKMWAMLADVSAQVKWADMKLTPTDWKEIFSAGIKKQRVVPDIDRSGFVILGAATSKMSKAEFATLIDLIQHFGDSQNVRWTEDK
jgi:hypothetical protein